MSIDNLRLSYPEEFGGEYSVEFQIKAYFSQEIDGQSKLQALQDAIVGGNIPQLVMNALSYAIEIRCSDVHIEPLKNTVAIRYRIDGSLRRIVEYPLNIHPAVTSRVKLWRI